MKKVGSTRPKFEVRKNVSTHRWLELVRNFLKKCPKNRNIFLVPLNIPELVLSEIFLIRVRLPGGAAIIFAQSWNSELKFLSRSSTSCVLCLMSCVLCFVSFYFLIFRVFAEVIFINAKIFSMLFDLKIHFGIYQNSFSKNTKNKEIKRHKTQNTKHNY